MNFKPLQVVMLVVGIVLIYSAIRDVKPQDVVTNALKGKPTVGNKGSNFTPPGTTPTPTPKPKEPPANTATFPWTSV